MAGTAQAFYCFVELPEHFTFNIPASSARIRRFRKRLVPVSTELGFGLRDLGTLPGWALVHGAEPWAGV